MLHQSMNGARESIRRVSENAGSIGAGLAYLVASVHLFHPKLGFPRLLLLVTTGNTSLLVYDPRPVAFVLSAVAILLGVRLAMADVGRERIYVLGMILVATYFVGYFAWHLSGHGGFLPGRKPLYHGLSPVRAVLSHLAGSPLAALSKLVEASLLVVLAVLYRREG